MKSNAEPTRKTPSQLADDGEPGDAFGSSVGIAGDAILVGAALDDDCGTNSGSAYAFRFDGTRWEQKQKLIPADGAPDDGFGTRVAIRFALTPPAVVKCPPA